MHDATKIQESLARLEATHTFPGPFTFRVIGPEGADFAARAMMALSVELGPSRSQAITLTSRQSAKGTYVSLAFCAHLLDAQEVLNVFCALKAVSGVRLVL